MLTPEYLHDVDGFGRRFFRELFARLPEGATLVLDNYQEVAPDQRFHALIAQTVDEVPSGSALIVVSRRDPPNCYARLVANENAAFIDWDALKLTLKEAETIAAEKGWTNPDFVRSIHSRADGWAAGVILMLERAQGIDAPTESAPESHQAIFDYFAAEIFARIDEEARGMLTATAWLPTVNPTVAAALTGSVHAETILEDLYRRHLFVHRRPGAPATYQYHALFRHYLQTQARREYDADTLRGLQARAARLLEQSNAVEPAIDLYCDSAAWDDAIRLIIACAHQLLAHGRGKMLEEWVTRLPADRSEHVPWLKYWLGVSKFASAPAATRALLEQAFQMFTKEDNVVGQLLGLIGIVESHWAEFSGDDEIELCLERAVPLLKKAPQFPDAETELRVNCVLYVAMLLRQPRNPMIASIRDRIVSLLPSKVSDDAKLLAGGALLADALQTGRMPLADRLLSTLDSLSESPNISPVARLMWVVRLPMYYTHKADYKKAHQALERAQTLLNEEGVLIGSAFLYYSGAFDSIVAGDLPAAELYVGKLEETHASNDRPLYRDLALWLRCAIALARGDARRAVELGRQAVAGAQARKLTWPIVWFGVATIYALIEAGEHREAETQIDTLRAFILGTFMSHFEVELLFAQAYLALKLGQREQSRELLQQGWALARQHDFVFGYRSAFRAHRVLFSESLRSEIEPDYVRSVIRRFKLRPEDASDDRWPWRIKVHTLGRFAVLLEDKPLAFGRKVPRKPVLLLKAMIAYGERGVSEK
ncbi:MAG TPA: hypothetical protein VMP00_17230, partial [Burkholderiales bacterium]|nr:hypothetical protein [Burkholderiales bacterium]